VPPSDRHQRRVWVDTDGGADDAVALLALVGAGARLVGVSTVGGVVDAATAAANAAGVLAAAGAVGPDGERVPVHVGGAPLRPPAGATHHGVDGIGGTGLGDPGAVHPRDGVDAVLDAARRHDDLDVLAIGPHTNLADALTRDPDLAGRLGEVVLVAGPGAVRDTNTWHDPAATARVLTGFEPVGRLRVVTLTATWSDPLDGAAPGAAPRLAAAAPGDDRSPAGSTPSAPRTPPASPGPPAWPPPSPTSPTSPASLASLAAAVTGDLRRSQSVAAGRDLLVPHDALAVAVWADPDTTAEVTAAGGSVADGVAVPTGAGRIRWVWRLDGAATWVARHLTAPLG
jgi:inosine-uridine nucleoside N-ribohydrolase